MFSDRLDVIADLAKRRGFVYPSSEIYSDTRAGDRHGWDYGPLGVELKNNVKRQWWQAMVTGRDDIVGVDSCVITPREVWEAAGHTEKFVDPLTRCQSCHRRYHANDITSHFREMHDRTPDPRFRDVNCPSCGTRGSLTAPRMSSGLMEAHSWSLDRAGRWYLRPETAQGIFINYGLIQQTSRKRPPFGIAQIGKAFRNEITPGKFLFRNREFEQMEMAFFVKPGAQFEWHQYWLDSRLQWYVDLGLNKDHLRFSERPAEKLPHYAQRVVDVEYRFDLTGVPWGTVESVTDRGDHDLAAHAASSGADLSYFDQEFGERWIPRVVAPSVGVDRAVLCFLFDAYHEDLAPNTKGGKDKRVVLRFDRRLAPAKAAVLPLSRNDELSPRARAVAAGLRQLWNVEFDDAGAIGRRYRRQDEIGTPFCVTLDFDTLGDNSATVRDRDSMAQERVNLDQLESYLAARLLCS